MKPNEGNVNIQSQRHKPEAKFPGPRFKHKQILNTGLLNLLRDSQRLHEQLVISPTHQSHTPAKRTGACMQTHTKSHFSVNTIQLNTTLGMSKNRLLKKLHPYIFSAPTVCLQGETQ